MTMLVITHEVGFARRAANKVVFMDDGAIVESAEPAVFFESPQSERAKDFLARFFSISTRLEEKLMRLGPLHLIGIVALLMALVLSGCGGGNQKKVTIGVKFDQPGLSMKNPDGSMSGFDVDVAKHVAEQLGYKPDEIEWKRSSVESTGNVDSERPSGIRRRHILDHPGAQAEGRLRRAVLPDGSKALCA